MRNSFIISPKITPLRLPRCSVPPFIIMRLRNSSSLNISLRRTQVHHQMLMLFNMRFDNSAPKVSFLFILFAVRLLLVNLLWSFTFLYNQIAEFFFSVISVCWMFWKNTFWVFLSKGFEMTPGVRAVGHWAC